MINSNTASTNFVYSVAGLRVLTNRRIPELEESVYTDDSVSVLFGAFEKLNTSTDGVPKDSDLSALWYRFPSKKDTSTYLREDGQVVLVSEIESSLLDYAAQVRRVIPFASALQGKVILHASAIRYGKSAIAFIGASGTGKSTLAKHLRAFGFTVICDDLLPVRSCASQALGPVDAGLSVSNDLPLRAAVFLCAPNRSNQLLFTPITKKQCLQQLVRNGFGELPAAKAWAAQFHVYHAIAENALAFRLHLPYGLDTLRESITILVEQFCPAVVRHKH